MRDTTVVDDYRATVGVEESVVAAFLLRDEDRLVERTRTLPRCA